MPKPQGDGIRAKAELKACSATKLKPLFSQPYLAQNFNLISPESVGNHEMMIISSAYN
ncbi:MAG: hypothetical protein IPK35_17110 [Saprospiraceae bacterium]|jgi:hypothetical protein|nr:hypothetical protein [Saprospiraceae bacterium]